MASAPSPTPPFDALSLNLCMPADPLPAERAPCPKCGRRKLYYCPECLLPTGPLPRVMLPLHVAVLRGADEKAEKSSSAHLAVLAPDNSSIHLLPDFPRIDDPEGVLLLFPSPASKLVRELPDLSRFHTIIAIDTTWGKVGSVLQMPELAAPFQHVAIASYHTLFWRYQPMGPTCVSTIEAVYYLLRELEVERERRRRITELQQQLEGEVGGTRPEAKSPFALPRTVAAQAAGDSAVPAADPAATLCSAATPVDPEAACQTGTRIFEPSSSSHALGFPRPLSLSDLATSAMPPCDPARHLYDGRFDPLLVLFLDNYRRIQREYTEGAAAGRTFTTRHRAGYIRGAAKSGHVTAASQAEMTSAEQDVSAVSVAMPGATDADPPSVDPSRKRSRAATTEASVDAAGSLLAPPLQQVRRKGAWAVRTDVLAPGVAEEQRRRNERLLENTRGLLPMPAVLVSGRPAEPTVEPAGDDNESASKPGLPALAESCAGALDVDAVAFLRTQHLGRHEYGTKH